MSRLSGDPNRRSVVRHEARRESHTCTQSTETRVLLPQCVAAVCNPAPGRAVAGGRHPADVCLDPPLGAGARLRRAHPRVHVCLGSAAARPGGEVQRRVQTSEVPDFMDALAMAKRRAPTSMAMQVGDAFAPILCAGSAARQAFFENYFARSGGAATATRYSGTPTPPAAGRSGPHSTPRRTSCTACRSPPAPCWR